MSEFVLVLFQDDIAGRFPWPYQPQVPPVSKTLTVSQADWATRRALVSWQEQSDTRKNKRDESMPSYWLAPLAAQQPGQLPSSRVL